MSEVENVQEDKKASSELDKLVKEKVQLAKKLGLMGGIKRKSGYEKTDEYKRIEEIDQKLWELVK